MTTPRFRPLTIEPPAAATAGPGTHTAARPPEPLPLPWDGRLGFRMGAWTCDTQWAVIDGRPGPVAIAWASDGTEQATARGPVPGGPVITAMRHAVEDALSNQAQMWDRHGEHQRAAELRALIRRSQGRPKARRPRISEDHLRAVAAVYNTAKTKPAQAVYLAFPQHLSRTLDRHIRRARDLGYIGPGRPS